MTLCRLAFFSFVLMHWGHNAFSAEIVFCFATSTHWISKTLKIIIPLNGSVRNFIPKRIRIEFVAHVTETICTQTMFINCNNAAQGWARVAVELRVMGARIWSRLGEFYI